MFINLTPHHLHIHGRPHITVIAPSGVVARVATTDTDAGMVAGIPTVRTELGAVTGLPAMQEGTIYIVSGMVAAAARRADVFSPGALVRDGNGRPVGCRGLRRSC